MIINFTEVQNIFIICGHTDMRCEIDGLASVVSDKYNLDLSHNAISCFMAEKKIATKLYTGIAMGLCYCTNRLKTETYNGQKIKTKSRN